MSVELKIAAENLVLGETSLKFCNVIQKVNCIIIIIIIIITDQKY
jgi:hypothetical protein